MTARRQREFRRRRRLEEWAADIQARLDAFEVEMKRIRLPEVAGLGRMTAGRQAADALPVAGRGHEVKSLASQDPPQPAGD